jgi:hypothetical protein
MVWHTTHNATSSQEFLAKSYRHYNFGPLIRNYFYFLCHTPRYSSPKLHVYIRTSIYSTAVEHIQKWSAFCPMPIHLSSSWNWIWPHQDSISDP